MIRVAAITFFFSILSLAAAVNNPVGATANAIPQSYPLDRYQASWKKNPFLLKTAPVVQQRETWAIDWALSSIAEIDGEFRVSIRNKKTGEYRRIHKDDKDAEFNLVSVNLQPDRKASSAELSKGGEIATLTYDQAAMAPAPRAATPAGQPGVRAPGAPAPGQPMTTAQVQAGAGSSAGRYYPTQSAVPSPGGFQRPAVGGVMNPGIPGAVAGGGQIQRSTVTAGVSSGSAAAGVAGSPPSMMINGVNVNAPAAGTAIIPGQSYVPTTGSGTVTVPAPTYQATPTPSTRRRQLIPAPLNQATNQ